MLQNPIFQITYDFSLFKWLTPLSITPNNGLLKRGTAFLALFPQNMDILGPLRKMEHSCPSEKGLQLFYVLTVLL